MERLNRIARFDFDFRSVDLIKVSSSSAGSFRFGNKCVEPDNKTFSKRRNPFSSSLGSERAGAKVYLQLNRNIPSGVFQRRSEQLQPKDQSNPA